MEGGRGSGAEPVGGAVEAAADFGTGGCRLQSGPAPEAGPGSVKGTGGPVRESSPGCRVRPWQPELIGIAETDSFRRKRRVFQHPASVAKLSEGEKSNRSALFLM